MESTSLETGNAQILSGPDRVIGVFSARRLAKLGTGGTSKKSVQTSYWFATERSDGVIGLQPLNANYVPTGHKRFLSRDQLLDEFAPEPEFYASTVYPRMRELNRTIARADRHRQNKETFSAEYEYGNALKVDEENIRANFGIGLTYLERGDTEKAEDVFRRLVRLEAAFETEHKHLFNDFGISMRKNGMHGQAVEYYERALELTQDDEHLFYNVARACFEKGDLPKAAAYLRQALSLKPSFPEALEFMAFLDKRNTSRDRI